MEAAIEARHRESGIRAGQNSEDAWHETPILLQTSPVEWPGFRLPFLLRFTPAPLPRVAFRHQPMHGTGDCTRYNNVRHEHRQVSIGFPGDITADYERRSGTP